VIVLKRRFENTLKSLIEAGYYSMNADTGIVYFLIVSYFLSLFMI
jgi:hypothetical protein